MNKSTRKEILNDMIDVLGSAREILGALATENEDEISFCK